MTVVAWTSKPVIISRFGHFTKSRIQSYIIESCTSLDLLGMIRRDLNMTARELTKQQDESSIDERKVSSRRRGIEKLLHFQPSDVVQFDQSTLEDRPALRSEGGQPRFIDLVPRIAFLPDYFLSIPPDDKHRRPLAFPSRMID